MLYYYYYYYYSYYNYRYKKRRHTGWILEDFSVNKQQTNITFFFLFIQTTDTHERAGGSF